MTDRVEGQVKGKQLRQAFEDIRSFERQLTDDGVVMVKFFLHISKHEQKQRFDALRESAATAWRVTEADLRQNQQYGEYLAAAEDMLTETDTEYAPWTVVEAHDRRFATLKAFATVIDALERGVAVAGRKADERTGAAGSTGSDDQCFQDNRARSCRSVCVVNCRRVR